MEKKIKLTLALTALATGWLAPTIASADRYYNWTNPSCFPDRAGNCMQPGGRGAGGYYDPRPTARPGYRPYYHAPRQQYVGPRGRGYHSGGSHGSATIYVPPQLLGWNVCDQYGCRFVPAR